LLKWPFRRSSRSTRFHRDFGYSFTEAEAAGSAPETGTLPEQLNKHRLATLLLDLLTTEEQQIDSETMQYRFDIPWLAERTQAVVQWGRGQPELQQLRSEFGASTGAAAAVMTAAAFPNQIRAVVSRGGRPDLAQEALDRVQAPTLFIVGEHDKVVLKLNRKAIQEMTCIKSIKIIPGATHLFKEPGTLEQVASAASDWFEKYMQHPQDVQIASGWR
jgi:putative phosphoribosyl transferase